MRQEEPGSNQPEPSPNPPATSQKAATPTDTAQSKPTAEEKKYTLPPRDYNTIEAEDYIIERVNTVIDWYDRKASQMKNQYLRMRAATVIGGALVPVFVNLDIPYIDVLTTIISLIVVLLVSLESVYHYREQWTNYRSTEQYLRNEYFLFASGSGVYSNLESEDATTHFVDRIEEIITAENSATLKIMTSLSESKTDTNTSLSGSKSGNRH